MSEQLISNMPMTKFDAVIDTFIERETNDMGELEAPLFYEALRKVIVSDITSEVAATIEVEGEIVENQLVLDLPEDLGAIELMRDIAILVGDRRIIVKWKEGSIYPTAH